MTEQLTQSTTVIGADEEQFITAAKAGDSGRFALLTERYRRELHVHCYRLLANYEDAQDMTQETFLRAWDKRETFQGRAALRTWLYRIATNTCLDFLAKRSDRIPVPTANPEAGAEVLYLQPMPDDPHDTAVARETIELAFIVAVQQLPPRQRAVLILRDVLGWPAQQTADTLELSVAAANSALQRARETMRANLPDSRLDWTAPSRRGLSADERELVGKYIALQENLNIEGLTELLREDLRFAMPPNPGVWVTRESAVASWIEGGFGKPPFDDWRGVATVVNGQPAAAMYLRQPGETSYRAFAIDVLRVVDGKVAEITGFEGITPSGANMFDWLGLPQSIEG